MRRAIRIVVLSVTGLLLLPYLLTPLYRIGHPVSTLMIWRTLSGAPMSRQWIDFSALPSALPRSVVASEDAKFCSHHGIDRVSLTGCARRCRGRRVQARRLDHHSASGKKSVPLAGTPHGPQGDGISAGDVDRCGTAQAANSRNLSEYRGMGAGRPVRCRSRVPLCLRAIRSQPNGAGSGALGCDPANPVRRSARRPGPGVRRLAGTYMVRARASELRSCWHGDRGL